MRDDAEQLIQDRQTVDQDERDLADAKNALRPARSTTQKRINDAETSSTRALDDQKKGDLADAQAVAAARNDVDTAEAEVAQQVAAKGVQEERPKNNAEVAAAQADVDNKQAVLDDAQRAARRHHARGADRRDRGGHRRAGSVRRCPVVVPTGAGSTPAPSAGRPTPRPRARCRAGPAGS